MVGVGIDGKDSMLARVSIVNSFGKTVYDTFVAPMQDVVDYRTEFSGVRPHNLVNGECWNSTDEMSNNNCVIFINRYSESDIPVLILQFIKYVTDMA